MDHSKFRNAIKEGLYTERDFHLPDNSNLIRNYEVVEQGGHYLRFNFDSYSHKRSDDPVIDLCLVINERELLHNCSCHKLVALCFFDWTTEAGFKPVLVTKSLPECQYLVLGMVEELMVPG